ncbi:hypothetical protein [Agrobacterium tumefaciens]|uniref:hypothetical protein n=1 Tax=Agrobacterium tumefaciens TaxID=358 RepID=UPI001574497D|nr:hypothetical protein [Agrobacterium tumefaciens]WCJ63798.1 hypothetical protein G6M15_06285 [Agrobacterium tumefaciens]
MTDTEDQIATIHRFHQRYGKNYYWWPMIVAKFELDWDEPDDIPACELLKRLFQLSPTFCRAQFEHIRKYKSFSIHPTTVIGHFIHELDIDAPDIVDQIEKRLYAVMSPQNIPQHFGVKTSIDLEIRFERWKRARIKKAP